MMHLFYGQYLAEGVIEGNSYLFIFQDTQPNHPHYLSINRVRSTVIHIYFLRNCPSFTALKR